MGIRIDPAFRLTPTEVGAGVGATKGLAGVREAPGTVTGRGVEVGVGSVSLACASSCSAWRSLR